MKLFSVPPSRLLLVSLLLAGVLVAMFAIAPSSRNFLKGSLLDDQVLTLGDQSPQDGTFSVREMRKAVTNMLRSIALDNVQHDAAYDLNGDGATDRADLTLLIQSIRAYLAAVCGNGTVDAGEKCDDGGTAIGDGCSAACTVESAFTCAAGNPSVCERIPVCGDRIIERGEECDDGDTTDAGFCTADCQNVSQIVCVAPQIPAVNFTSTKIASKADQVITVDMDADGFYELALRDGMTVNLVRKDQDSASFTQFLTNTFTGTKAFMAAFDDRRSVSSSVVVLSQVPRFPNLSNPNPDYYINTYVRFGIADDSLGSLSSLTNASRTAPLFTLSRKGGFLGPVYRGTTPSSYAPLERIPNLSQPTNRTTLQQNFLGTGPQPLFQYAKLSKNTLGNGRHLIVTGYGGFSTPRQQIIIDDNVNTLVSLGASSYQIVYAIDAADVTADGKPEIVAAMFDNAQSKFVLSVWDEQGVSLSSSAIPTLGTRTSMGIADIDGDGDTDIALGSENGVFWLEQFGSSWITHDVRTAAVNDLAFADVTGDGRPDIVVAAADGTYVYAQVQSCVLPAAPSSSSSSSAAVSSSAASIASSASLASSSSTASSCPATALNGNCACYCSGTTYVKGNASCPDYIQNPCAPAAVCGNGIRETGEQCDDGKPSQSGDGCSTTCAVEAKFTCTGAPSVCLSYNAIVKRLADTNANGIVDDREALNLALDMINAPDQPYAAKFDINGDAVVNQIDSDIVMSELTSLAPLS